METRTAHPTEAKAVHIVEVKGAKEIARGEQMATVAEVVVAMAGAMVVAAMGAAVRAAMGAAVRAAMGAAVRAAMGAALAGPLGASCGAWGEAIEQQELPPYSSPWHA